MNSTETKNRNYLLYLYACILAVCLSSYLRWDRTPLQWKPESDSVSSFMHNPSNICSSNPYAGLEGVTSNVADGLLHSSWYSIPAKIFRNSIDIYSFGRIWRAILFLICLLVFSTICLQLGLGLGLSMFCLTFYALSTQTLAALIEARLTITAVTWLLATLLLFIFNEKRIGQLKSAGLSTALCGVALLLAYDSYAVCRVIAPVLWFALILRLCVAKQLHLLAAFALGSALGLGIIIWEHPQITFSWNLIDGRSEGAIDTQGNLRLTGEQFIRRIKELVTILNPMERNIIDGTSEMTIGWLEVICANVLAVIVLLPLIRKTDFWQGLWQRRWVLYYLVTISCVSIVAPLFSITEVRGHRLFGFYVSSILIAIILWRVIFTRAKLLLNSISCCLAMIWILAFFPLVSGNPWIVPRLAPAFYMEMIQKVSELKKSIIPNASAQPVKLVICDQAEDLKPVSLDLNEHWLAILYVSGFLCQAHVDQISLQCPCPLDANLCLHATKAPDLEILLVNSSTASISGASN